MTTSNQRQHFSAVATVKRPVARFIVSMSRVIHNSLVSICCRRDSCNEAGKTRVKIEAKITPVNTLSDVPSTILAGVNYSLKNCPRVDLHSTVLSACMVQVGFVFVGFLLLLNLTEFGAFNVSATDLIRFYF